MEQLAEIGTLWAVFVLPVVVWGLVEYGVCRLLKWRAIHWFLPAFWGAWALWCLGGICFSIPFPQILPPSDFFPAPWAALILVGPAVLGVFLGLFLWSVRKRK